MPEKITQGGVQANAVSKRVTIHCGLEKAFTVFTDRMGAWWPATHHIGATPFRDIAMEHRTGGRWYEVNDHGEECQWGTVLLWEPPLRVVVSWHLGPDWQYDPAMERASEVEVTFRPETPDITHIELVHRCLERHGADYGKLRDEVDQPGGWSAVLESFKQKAEEGGTI